MKRIRRVKQVGMSLVAAVAILASASVARADFVNRVLLTAPGTLGAPFQNTQNFLATNGTDTLDVNVDYAVWGPGQFAAVGGNYIPFAGFLPLTPADYVYAYQVYDNGPTHGASNRAFSQLGINSIGGTVSSLGKDPNYDPSAADIDTNFAFLSPQGASYLFLVPTIHVNEFSVVLLLASPQPPSFAQASVFDSGLSANGHVPMPVPEPGTLVLVALGFGLLRRKARN